MPGLRITNYRLSVVIAFVPGVGSGTVSILDVFHGGQDYEAALQETADE